MSQHVPVPGDDSRMRVTYIAVLVVQVVVTVVLWWFGRTFSR